MDLKKKNATCNDFVFIRTLGAGYNAKVKLAFDKKSGKYVAVKIIKKIDRNNLKTLQNELNIMSQLKHPNIIELLDVQQNQDYLKKNGQSKKVTYIVIELAQGGELFDYVANTGAFDYDTARSYFQQLINALEYCHALKIAHRDLKPENLLFDSEFRLKVADFGFATLIKESLKNQTVLGTESYMAPEIHAKTPYNSNEVDLFASAIVLFIMIVGTPPFTKADLKDPYYNLIASNKLDRFWQQHLKFKKDKNFFTEQFRDLIGKMLQLDPKNRLTLEQIQAHPFMKQNQLQQIQLTQQFAQKKLIVDQEIQQERQRKLIEKNNKVNQINGNTAMTGFRSGNTDLDQQFNTLEQQFDFKSQRNIENHESNQEIQQLAFSKQVGTVYTHLEPELLVKYLILTLIQENVQQENINLNSNKYKVDFIIQDNEENIEVEAEITKYDELVNQITFMKKSGNTISYYNYIKNIKEQLNKIKEKL